LETWTDKNKGNEVVEGLANDLFYNAFSANLQQESDANYALRLTPLELERQRGLQGIATEADLRLMAAEGGIYRDLTAQKGKIDKGLARINSRDVRNIANANLAGTRYTADAGVKSTRIGASATRAVANTNLRGTRYAADAGVKSTQIGADAQRYGADRQVDATRIGADAQRYGADRQVDATRIEADAQRYGYDTQLAGTRDTNRSQEEQLRIRGDQERKTLTQGTDEALRLRVDARGAVTARGRRFYG